MRRLIIGEGSHRERVVFRNRANLEGRLGHDAEGAERAGQHLHEIVAGDVFDHAAARANDAPAVADILNADQQVAHGSFRQPQRTGVRRARSASRAWSHPDREDRPAAAVRASLSVAFRSPTREARLRDHRHVLGLVRDDVRHAPQRNSDPHRSAADLGERSRGAHRREADFVRLAFAHDGRDLLGALRLDDRFDRDALDRRIRTRRARSARLHVLIATARSLTAELAFVAR